MPSSVLGSILSQKLRMLPTFPHLMYLKRSLPIISNIAVLMASHNRRDKTLECLRAIFNNSLPDNVTIQIFLVDDGSEDGTAEAVATFFPAVKVLSGDGTLFWNGAMALAFGVAKEQDFDYYLWLNDDTILFQDSLKALIATADTLKKDILVGPTCDSLTGEITYGGLMQYGRWRPTKFQLVEPNGHLFECHTMNGNCVLISKAVADEIGNLDTGFCHGMGDIDYGLRARNRGFRIWVMPHCLGTCSRNPQKNNFADPELPVCVRFKKIFGPKGLPLRTWLVFTRRHGGIFWFLYWLWPYVKVFLLSFTWRSFLPRRRR